MNLTSYERLRRYLAQKTSDNLTDNWQNRRDLQMWIAAVSKQIELFTQREFEIKSRTEYFDTTQQSREFWLRGVPVVSITSVYEDPSGEFDGGESELTDYFQGTGGRSVVLTNASAIGYTARRAIRVIYTGGLGYSATESIFAVSSVTGTWTVGKFCIGATSLAVGVVRAVTVTALTIEILYGDFIAGETLSEYDSESSAGTSDGSAVLDSKTQEALCESHPAIVAACDTQISYMFRNKLNYEQAGVNKDGFSFRRNRAPGYTLEPEVETLLLPYKRLFL